MTARVIAATVAPFVRRARARGSSVASDFWALTKPEVNLLIAITTAVGFCLGAGRETASFRWPGFLLAVAGTTLAAGGAAALNQWLEREHDARMRRTARRPVAAGRIPPDRALGFGLLLSLAGIGVLAAGEGVAALLAALTLVAYLGLYTPAKRKTSWCIWIGAVPGAIPPLIGWAAARGRLDAAAWILFGIVFLWQVPHFMAIAWMHRADYDRAGYRVLPPGEAAASFVTRQTRFAMEALVPVSVLPLAAGLAGPLYGMGALIAGVAFADCAARFTRGPSDGAARRLLLASILYLPLLFTLLLLPWPGASAADTRRTLHESSREFATCNGPARLAQDGAPGAIP
ncbi:MAG TPA: heme o synthase [Candidatus Polarisedimenticolia bacterium]|nr:heme o synthase [Candidatus Polarisedimenticolia bacterium]